MDRLRDQEAVVRPGDEQGPLGGVGADCGTPPWTWFSSCCHSPSVSLLVRTSSAAGGQGDLGGVVCRVEAEWDPRRELRAAENYPPSVVIVL